MKVNCESCGKPITAQVNSLFEQFEPGRVVCPHCHHQQKRYISEADLLIYFCFSAVLYSIVLVLIFFLLNWKMQAWILTVSYTHLDVYKRQPLFNPYFSKKK